MYLAELIISQKVKKNFRPLVGKSDLYMREGEEVCDKAAQDKRTRI